MRNGFANGCKKKKCSTGHRDLRVTMHKEQEVLNLSLHLDIKAVNEAVLTLIVIQSNNNNNNFSRHFTDGKASGMWLL